MTGPVCVRRTGGYRRRVPIGRPPRALAALLAAGAVAAAAAPAGAATFTFTGRGFGHGVGLSQYGAYGAALAGWKDARILRHYYPGTTLTTVPAADRRVRVLVAEERRAVTVTGTRDLVLQGGAGGTARLPAGAVTLRAAGTDVEIATADGTVRRARGPLTITSAQPLAVGRTRYRGRLEAHPVESGRVDVVDDLPLEAYLRGVVPMEIPADWAETAPASVRAQAIVARSYALAARARGDHYELHADTRSQVYGGIDAEDPRTDRAIRATSGRVVAHGGAIARTVFFSTSGGRTEDAATVWGAPAPYLVSRPDPFDARSPYHRWPDPVRVTGAALARGLDLPSPVTALRITGRGVSPRVTRVAVTTADGATTTVTGADVQAAAGLRSTWFAVRPG